MFHTVTPSDFQERKWNKEEDIKNPGVLDSEQAVEPQWHHARSSVCLLICQSAPVDYSWLPRGDKLISTVRSLYRSSDRVQEDTNWHSLCRKCAHNPSFGSKRFLEKLALTFRNLPSVARWCAEWNLDCSPTKCKAVFFLKRTEHLLRNVILGWCLFSLFNTIWFISNWCKVLYKGLILLKFLWHLQAYHLFKDSFMVHLNESCSLIQGTALKMS